MVAFYPELHFLNTRVRTKFNFLKYLLALKRAYFCRSQSASTAGRCRRGVQVRASWGTGTGASESWWQSQCHSTGLHGTSHIVCIERSQCRSGHRRVEPLRKQRRWPWFSFYSSWGSRNRNGTALLFIGLRMSSHLIYSRVTIVSEFDWSIKKGILQSDWSIKKICLQNVLF